VATDSSVDLTIDFGFATRLGVGNLVFRDNNADGKYTAGMRMRGIPGITRGTRLHSDGSANEETAVGSTTITDDEWRLHPVRHRRPLHAGHLQGAHSCLAVHRLQQAELPGAERADHQLGTMTI
jgi:hypothetical protein